jgi:prophage regulatory protein
MTSTLQQDRFLRRSTVEQITGQSTSNIYEGMKAGTFPLQVKLNPESKRSPVAWLESEIRQWQAARVEARDNANRRKCAPRVTNVTA